MAKSFLRYTLQNPKGEYAVIWYKIHTDDISTIDFNISKAVASALTGSEARKIVEAYPELQLTREVK